MFLEKLSNSRPQPRMLDRAIHILLGHSLSVLSLRFARILEFLIGSRSWAAHGFDGRRKGGREEGNDGADVGRWVGRKADFGFKGVKFDCFLCERAIASEGADKRAAAARDGRMNHQLCSGDPVFKTHLDGQIKRKASGTTASTSASLS